MLGRRTQSMHSTIQILLDRQAVIDTVSRMCCAFDEQDWPALRACLADTLDTDYSRFRGTPPARLTADEFVRLRKVGLAGLRTQHLSFNHLVEVTGERARCRCDFIIHRWPVESADPRFFHTYGFYRYEFIRAAEGWRICGITQFVLRSEGSPELHGAHRTAGFPAP